MTNKGLTIISYPLSTFSSETQKEIQTLIENSVEKARQERDTEILEFLTSNSFHTKLKGDIEITEYISVESVFNFINKI